MAEQRGHDCHVSKRDEDSSFHLLTNRDSCVGDDMAGFTPRQTVILPSIHFPCVVWVRDDTVGTPNEHVFIQVDAPLTIDTTSELPLSFDYEGVEFSRYCGFFYLPTVKSEAEFASFWDYLGEEYDRMTDPKLHEGVYNLLARKIGLPCPTPLIILDYGVGTGLYTAKILSPPESHHVLYGVDISSTMVQLASLKGIRSARIAGGKLPYPNELFNAIVSCFTTHLFTDFSPFEEWFRVLKPGGKIAFNHRYPQPDFSQRFMEGLALIGFIDVVTDQHQISTSNKEWHLWLTTARKPLRLVGN